MESRVALGCGPTSGFKVKDQLEVQPQEPGGQPGLLQFTQAAGWFSL